MKFLNHPKFSIIRILCLFTLCYILACLITPFSPLLKNRSIKNQINFLIDQANADDKLQEVYPEGLMFFNALLALSIIEYSHNSSKDHSFYSSQVESIINKMLSEKATENFPLNQQLPRGAFYNGWLNFTIKKYLQCPLIEYSKSIKDIEFLHDSLSLQIVNTQKDSLTILESYPGANWPADNLVCLVSLDDPFKELKNDWVQLLKSNSTSSLINHDFSDLSVSRGSSQSLIIYLLSEFDLHLAKKEHSTFKKLFIESKMGIDFVKEDLGNKKFYDIDSGPVILGYGSVATIVNVKAQKGINAPTNFTEGFINLIGLPINVGGKKFYLFKQEKMFDVFMLWIQQ